MVTCKAQGGDSSDGIRVATLAFMTFMFWQISGFWVLLKSTESAATLFTITQMIFATGTNALGASLSNTLVTLNVLMSTAVTATDRS